jgi:hypothetical protein
MKRIIFALYCVSSLAMAGQLTKENFVFESDPKAMVTNISVIVRTGSIHDEKGKEGSWSYFAFSVCKTMRSSWCYTLVSMSQKT